MKNKFVLITLVALAAGSIPAFAKFALELLDPFTLVFFRFFAASIVIYFFMSKKELSLRKFQDLKWVAFFGALNPIFLFISLNHLPANIIALLYSIVPGMSVIYLWLIKNDRVKSLQIAGFVAGIIGMAVISQETVTSKTGGNPWLGLSLAAVAVISFFIYGIASKEKQRSESISGTALAFYFSVLTALITLPLAIYETASNPWLENINVGYLLAVLYVGFIATGVQYLVFQKALSVMEAAYANLFIYIQPIVGVVLAFFILGEEPSLQLLTGGLIALFGVRLALNQKIKIPIKK